MCDGGGGLFPKTPFSPCQNVDVSLIPLKHNKSYLKARWTCRGGHSQENHFQLCVFLTFFSSRAPFGWTPPGGWGACPIAQTDRCSRPPERGALGARPLRLHPRLNHVDSYGTFEKSGHGSRPDKIHKTFPSGSVFVRWWSYSVTGLWGPRRQGRWAANLKWPSTELCTYIRDIPSFTELYALAGRQGCHRLVVQFRQHSGDWNLQPVPASRSGRIPTANVSHQLRRDRQP